DRRTASVLTRPGAEVDLVAADQQVEIRRRHIDVTALQALAVLRLRHSEVTGAPQDLIENAGALGHHVEHDEDRRRQLGGQLRDQPLQGLDAPGRGSHHDQIALDDVLFGLRSPRLRRLLLGSHSSARDLRLAPRWLVESWASACSIWTRAASSWSSAA